MPKPSSGSNRYLKAQLRPLTKPVFWASAGLFGLSLFALFTLFRQPDEVLSNGDPDAVVNLDENDSLTPEERARAAEIDDLSVLLKDLDKSKTIDSVSGRLNDTQTTNLEAPEAIANLESNKPSTSAAASSGSDFKQLPLLDLSPQSQANSIGSPSATSGFIGFDPRSSGQVGGSTTSPTTNAITPLAAALERNDAANAAAAASSDAGTTSPPETSSSIGITTSSQRIGALSNGVQPNGSPTYTTPISTPTIATPNYGSSQGLTAQNSSNNTYSQLLNPNLVAPPAPLNPTPTSPVLPAQPATASASPSLGQAQINRYNSGTIAAPSSSSIPQATQTPVFGAPSSSTAAPTLTNPAPYSVPNTTPGQYSGNGQINTFANP